MYKSVGLIPNSISWINVANGNAEKLKELDKKTNPISEELEQKKNLNWIREYAYPSLAKPFSAAYIAMFE